MKVFWLHLVGLAMFIIRAHLSMYQGYSAVPFRVQSFARLRLVRCDDCHNWPNLQSWSGDNHKFWLRIFLMCSICILYFSNKSKKDYLYEGPYYLVPYRRKTNQRNIIDTIKSKTKNDQYTRSIIDFPMYNRISAPQARENLSIWHDFLEIFWFVSVNRYLLINLDPPWGWGILSENQGIKTDIQGKS